MLLDNGLKIQKIGAVFLVFITVNDTLWKNGLLLKILKIIKRIAH